MIRLPVGPAVSGLVAERRLPVSSLDRVVTWHVIGDGQVFISPGSEMHHADDLEMYAQASVTFER